MNTKYGLPAELNEKWESLGFSPQTFRLLLLVPPIQTGWAEGYLQAAEKRIIIDYAMKEVGFGITDKEFNHLERWLNVRPADESFELMNEILSEWLASLPEKESKKWRDTILRVCLEVAQASPQIGFLRNSKSLIRREENIQIEKISRLLSMAQSSFS